MGGGRFLSSSFSAFTLAEVLVTLGIIGVVASLTLPTLIHKHRNKVMETQFKTAYSLIIRATYQMYMEHEADFVDFLHIPHGMGYMDEYIKRFYELVPDYLQVVETIDSERLKNIKMYTSNNYVQEYISISAYGFNLYILNNGMLLAFSAVTDGHIIISVDTNGPYKGPNRYGYDLFKFYMCRNGKILAPGEDDDYVYNRPPGNYSSRCSFNPSDTKWSAQGEQCSYWAIRDNYPGSSTKSYWKNLP